MPGDRDSSQHVQSVERVFAVIRTFGGDNPSLTLSEVAKRAGLTRATARRLLLTLESLGYVGSRGRAFFLRPRMLDLGFAYLASVPVWGVVQGHLEILVQRVMESSSASVLDGPDIIYTVRVPTKRIMSIQIEVGTRLPAFATSMGRVLLASLGEEELESYLGEASLTRLTSQTLTTPDQLRKTLDVVREQGWCMLDQELEIGVRSIAVPLHDSVGRVFAAANISTQAARVPAEQLQQEILPQLLDSAKAIDDDIVALRWEQER